MSLGRTKGNVFPTCMAKSLLINYCATNGRLYVCIFRSWLSGVGVGEVFSAKARPGW